MSLRLLSSSWQRANPTAIGIVLRFWIASCLVVVPALAASATDEVNRTKQLQLYMQAASESLGVEQVDALAKIKDEDRRYLAMTYYQRAGQSIAPRWSWTSERIKAYEQSTEFGETLSEIKKIADRFSAENPHYVLYANTQVRSLEEQLTRWQTVPSIGAAASELRQAALVHLAQESYANASEHALSEISVKRFQNFLGAWRASSPPTLAAPGLSLHGQGRAYDFQIRDKNGRTVAGTDTSTIRAVWDSQGWAEKLSQAVHKASSRFVGPLAMPREPWHYEYRPANYSLP